MITLIAYSIVGNDTTQTIINVGNCTNYTVATSSNPVAGGTTTGGGTYVSAASVTVTATANNGYTFINWTENGNVVSTNASYTFNISANRNLVANFDAITGLNEQNILSVFYIYPNPASTLLYFDGAGNEEDFTFALYKTTGQFLMKGKCKNQIDVSSLNPGIYFLQVIDKNGKSTSIKFIKE